MHTNKSYLRAFVGAVETSSESHVLKLSLSLVI